MRTRLLLLTIMAVLLAAGCRGQTTPISFYTLSALADAPMAQRPVRPPVVGVGPLEIPRALARPHIVTSLGANQLRLSEFHRWGGDLEDDMLQVITQNLSVLLGSERVVAYPWAGFIDPEFRVPVEVQRLDGSLGQEVVLAVTWAVARDGASKGSTVRRSTIREKADGDDYAALVAAYSRALATLSREIAAEIAALQAAG